MILFCSDDESDSEDDDSADGDIYEGSVPALNRENESGDENDSDSSPRKSKPAKSKSPKRTQKKTVRKVTIRTNDNRKKTKKQTKASSDVENHARQVRSALTALAKKVLDESETPETSILAVLLQAARSSTDSSSVTSVKKRLSTPATIYTRQLELAAKALAKKHGQSMTLHNVLLNLIFRSVGGSVDSMLEGDADLEDLSDNQWDDLINRNVDDMQETDADCTLLCANPDGALADSHTYKAASLALREYRSIFEEFWFRLGDAILSGAASMNTRHNDEDNGNDSDSNSRPQSSAKFDIDIVRDLMSRLTELAPVGQPDLRAAAVIAVFQLGLACLEHSVDLEAKLEVAKRQFSAAKNSRRSKDIRNSIDSWKRQKADLDELVQGHAVNGLFSLRYRDSNPHIRRSCLDALSKFTLLRPDIFLMDKYLKYFAWMCSDKDAGVRLSGLSGLLAPFECVAKEKGKTTSNMKRPTSLKVDLSSMLNVCTKFLDRLVDCTEDSESTKVQEIAMKLLRAMMDEGFLDEWDNEDGWDQVNLKTLDKNTSAQVRKDALYFVFEQMDSFDPGEEGNQSTQPVPENVQFERVESLSTW